MPVSKTFFPITSIGKRSRILFLILLILSTLLLVAWQANVTYGHLAPYGGQADSGNHRGQVELSGGYRNIRAGDDYVKWTSGQVSWIISNIDPNHRPAMVYHAFAPNTNNCGDIRIVNMSWSWSNLPGAVYWSKRTCASGNDNEWRAIMYNIPVAGTNYYFQHLFRDTKYPSSRGTGQITVDSYWDTSCMFGHCSDYNDYHGKFCINSTTDVAYNPASGSC